MYRDLLTSHRDHVEAKRAFCLHDFNEQILICEYKEVVKIVNGMVLPDHSWKEVIVYI